MVLNKQLLVQDRKFRKSLQKAVNVVISVIVAEVFNREYTNMNVLYMLPHFFSSTVCSFWYSCIIYIYPLAKWQLPLSEADL